MDKVNVSLCKVSTFNTYINSFDILSFENYLDKHEDLMYIEKAVYDKLSPQHPVKKHAKKILVKDVIVDEDKVLERFGIESKDVYYFYSEDCGEVYVFNINGYEYCIRDYEMSKYLINSKKEYYLYKEETLFKYEVLKEKLKNYDIKGDLLGINTICVLVNKSILDKDFLEFDEDCYCFFDNFY